MAGRGINKVILIGNLGADPETRRTPNDMAVTRIRVATTERRKDRNTGEWMDHTEWHRVVLFGRLGEVAAQYLRKGSKVYIEGSLRTSKWQDQNGQDRYTTEIIANEMQMLDSRGSGDAPFDQPPERPAAQPAARPTEEPADLGGYEDDIPF